MNDTPRFGTAGLADSYTVKKFDPAAIAAYTPVPGGIGSVTTALLLRHTVQAAEKSHHF